MAKPRSMSASIGGWGDFTDEKEKNAQHNAREAQLDREEREGGRAITRRNSRTYRRPFSGAPAMFGTLPTPGEQYAMSQGALNAAMDNVRRENDSRVSQRREMRRMANDYEIERMRQMGANQRAQIDAEASLIRQLLAEM